MGAGLALLMPNESSDDALETGELAF